MLRGLYLLFGLLVIGAYAWVSWQGLELTRANKQKLSGPQGVRGTTGGAVFYRGGYRGGK